MAHTTPLRPTGSLSCLAALNMRHEQYSDCPRAIPCRFIKENRDPIEEPQSGEP
jgi:hypothetical protein